MFRLLAIGALCVGCSAARPAYLSLQQQRFEPPPVEPARVLSAAALAEDVGLALLALEKGYSGRLFAPPAAWVELVARLRELSQAPMTAGAFCDALADALWLLPDAHLTAKRQVGAQRANQRCGQAHRTAQRSPSVGQNLGTAVKRERPWLMERRAVESKTVGVVALTSFPPGGAPAWQGFDEAVTAVVAADAIVVDLRGNGGGDDTRGFQLARALLDGPTRTGVIRTHLRQTPETLTLLLNMYDRQGRRADGALEPYLHEAYADVEAWRARVLASPGAEFVVKEPAPFVLRLGPKAFHGRVAVLVDAACASSCESTMEALRRYPLTRVFGERTAGFVHFGDVGTVTLPRSGVRLGVPTKFHEYPGGAFYDKVGFAPDEAVTNGTDAFEVALAWVALDQK